MTHNRDLREQVGWLVRRALDEDGLSQRSLADALGLSRRGLHRKLWGQRDFLLLELIRAAKFLDRSVGAFIPESAP